MNKKYIVIVLIAAFSLGISSLGLCLTDKHENKSNCCSDKSAPISTPGADCLWHCAAKKIVGAKTEDLSIKSLRISMPLFLHDKTVDVLAHSFYHSNHSAGYSYYLAHQITYLSTCQSYFKTVLNRAPPALH